MFFDLLTLSNQPDNHLFRKLEKVYDESCEWRHCVSYLDAKKKIRERRPDFVLIFVPETDVQKPEYKFAHQALRKLENIKIIFCCDDESFIEKQTPSDNQLFLEAKFFEKNYSFVLKTFLEESKKENVKNFGHYPVIFDQIVGDSLPVRKLQRNIKRNSASKAKLLLTGENGNEYDDIAYLIHKNSRQCQYNFASYDIATNANAGLKEIFGVMNEHKITKKSLLEFTHNGTIFIKNIHLLSSEDKEKFILFLRNNFFSHIGDKNQITTNNRIITFIPASEMAKSQNDALNKELLDRLSIEHFEVPSLNKRKEDFKTICDYLIKKISAEFGRENIAFDSDLLLKLEYLDWKGNVDELFFYLKLLLKNILNNNPQSVIYQNSQNNFDFAILNKNLKLARKIFEKNYLKIQLERFGGNITNTAKFIRMNRVALHKKLRDLGIKTILPR